MRPWSLPLIVFCSAVIWILLPTVDCFCVPLSRDAVPNFSRRVARRWQRPSFSSSLASSATTTASRNHDNDNNSNNNPTNMIRLNKVFKATHSRRQADALIAAGRVKVNGERVTTKGGRMVTPFCDVVSLDEQVVHGWEALNGIATTSSDNNKERAAQDNNHDDDTTTRVFEYIKYWKPRGVTCTTDTRIRGNIIDEITRNSGYSPMHRVFPVGRLDKDTSGLILLTSDGRLPNSFLRAKQKQPKVYNVMVDKPLKEQDVERLRNGVVITTVAQRDGRRAKPLTAATKPCQVRLVNNTRGVQMTLYEGRNRQIRKMMAALDYEVVRLHRVAFGGIRLHPLEGPGDWEHLSQDEIKIVSNLLQEEQSSNNGSDEKGWIDDEEE